MEKTSPNLNNNNQFFYVTTTKNSSPKQKSIELNFDAFLLSIFNFLFKHKCNNYIPKIINYHNHCH